MREQDTPALPAAGGVQFGSTRSSRPPQVRPLPLGVLDRARGVNSPPLRPTCAGSREERAIGCTTRLRRSAHPARALFAPSGAQSREKHRPAAVPCADRSSLHTAYPAPRLTEPAATSALRPLTANAPGATSSAQLSGRLAAAAGCWLAAGLAARSRGSERRSRLEHPIGAQGGLKVLAWVASRASSRPRTAAPPCA